MLHAHVDQDLLASFLFKAAEMRESDYSSMRLLATTVGALMASSDILANGTCADPGCEPCKLLEDAYWDALCALPYRERTLIHAHAIENGYVVHLRRDGKLLP